MFDYENPIKIIADEIKYEYEANVVKAVQNYFIDIDKERLQKALEYDSDQYKKGWHDGQKEAHKHGHWEIRKGFNRLQKCSACGYEYNDLIECDNYCGNCGAKMDEEVEG